MCLFLWRKIGVSVHPTIHNTLVLSLYTPTRCAFTFFHFFFFFSSLHYPILVTYTTNKSEQEKIFLHPMNRLKYRMKEKYNYILHSLFIYLFIFPFSTLSHSVSPDCLRQKHRVLLFSFGEILLFGRFVCGYVLHICICINVYICVCISTCQAMLPTYCTRVK